MSDGRSAGESSHPFSQALRFNREPTNAISCGPDMGPAEPQDREGNLLVMSPFVSLT